jgi:hypothetical protein
MRIRNLFHVLFLVAVIENVNGWIWKSTYCPSVEPMSEFQWEPVRLAMNKYKYNSFLKI